ncbi:MAG: GNAT family N-acetyltransferase [Gammaproteobacteria bacterium]|nr:MAG: GNAT family N-acetyltransferase [Gammaproteobacteria bacterium]
MTPQFEIIACPPERREALYRLRAAVWLDEGASPAAFDAGQWTDARDATRRHWIALHQDEVIAGASLSIHDGLRQVEEAEAYLAYDLPEDGPVAVPARVVVHRDWRGRGVVQRLLDIQEEAARDSRAVLAVRQASRMMRPLLARRGWRYHGPGPQDPRFPREQFAVMSWLPGSR